MSPSENEAPSKQRSKQYGESRFEGDSLRWRAMVALADKRLGDPLALEDWDWMKAAGIRSWEVVAMTMATKEVVGERRVEQGTTRRSSTQAGVPWSRWVRSEATANPRRKEVADAMEPR